MATPTDFAMAASRAFDSAAPTAFLTDFPTETPTAPPTDFPMETSRALHWDSLRDGRRVYPKGRRMDLSLGKTSVTWNLIHTFPNRRSVVVNLHQDLHRQDHVCRLRIAYFDKVLNLVLTLAKF
jgi:hypothetical protein